MKETVVVTKARFEELVMAEVKRDYFEKMCNSLMRELQYLKRKN